MNTSQCSNKCLLNRSAPPKMRGAHLPLPLPLPARGSLAFLSRLVNSSCTRSYWEGFSNSSLWGGGGGKGREMGSDKEILLYQAR